MPQTGDWVVVMAGTNEGEVLRTYHANGTDHDTACKFRDEKERRYRRLPVTWEVRTRDGNGEG